MGYWTTFLPLNPVCSYLSAVFILVLNNLYHVNDLIRWRELCVHSISRPRGPTVVVAFLVLYLITAIIFRYLSVIPDPSALPGMSLFKSLFVALTLMFLAGFHILNLIFKWNKFISEHLYSHCNVYPLIATSNFSDDNHAFVSSGDSDRLHQCSQPNLAAPHNFQSHQGQNIQVHISLKLSFHHWFYPDISLRSISFSMTNNSPELS